MVRNNENKTIILRWKEMIIWSSYDGYACHTNIVVFPSVIDFLQLSFTRREENDFLQEIKWRNLCWKQDKNFGLWARCNKRWSNLEIIRFMIFYEWQQKKGIFLQFNIKLGSSWLNYMEVKYLQKVIELSSKTR